MFSFKLPLLRYQDIPGLAPPSGKEYFPLGSVAEKRPALPTLAESNTEDDDDDNEIVCYRSEQLEDKQLLNGNGVVHGNCEIYGVNNTWGTF